MASTTPNNTSDLKAWVVWAKKQKDLSEDVPHFVKAVEDLISQAGMVPALKAERAKLREFVESVARGPYPDSDPASLLETLVTRAKALMGGTRGART